MMWWISRVTDQAPQTDAMRIVELAGGVGLFGFLALMAVLVHLRPTDEDTGTPPFVWAVGIVLLIAAVTLLGSAGLVDFK